MMRRGTEMPAGTGTEEEMEVMTDRPNHHYIQWLDGGREPQCPPNPEYPNGCVIDCSGSAMIRCEVDLPYPAPRCGGYRITCFKCAICFALTAAGRPDDPVRVLLPCYTLINETSEIRKLPA